MRKLLLTFAALLPLVAASQPREWNPKPMCEFGNDTVAYIKHNFNPKDENMQAYFKGKTSGEIIPELGFEVKRLIPQHSESQEIMRCYGIIFVAAIEGGGISKVGGSSHGVMVSLATPVSAQNNPVAYNKLTKERDLPFDKELFDLIKEMKGKHVTQITLTLVDIIE